MAQFNLIFEDCNIRAFNDDGEVFIALTDVCNALGYKNPSSTISRYKINPIKISTLTNGGEQLISYINSVDLIFLLQRLKTASTDNKIAFKNFLVKNGIINDCVILETRKEIEFIEALIDALRPFNLEVITQKKVLNYFIDIYIPAFNVAIEYDENDHKNYNTLQEKTRQKEISKSIGCKFIRVGDKKNNCWNIGFVIKNIFML